MSPIATPRAGCSACMSSSPTSPDANWPNARSPRAKRGSAPSPTARPCRCGSPARRPARIRQPGLSSIFFGRTYDEALNFDWRKALHPDDLPRILHEQRVRRSSLTPFTVEARYRRGDGQWRWLRSELQPRWSPMGEHVGFIGVAHDVTDAKKAEEELTRSTKRWSGGSQERTAAARGERSAGPDLLRAFAGMPRGAGRRRRGSFRFQEVNPATLRLYGMARERGRRPHDDEVLGPEGGRGGRPAIWRPPAHRRRPTATNGRSWQASSKPWRRRCRGGEAMARRVVVSARDVTRAAPARGAVAPGAEDGGAGPAHRRRRARFQQSC